MIKIGLFLEGFDNLLSSTFSIITTNKKSTAIAPTYTTISNIAKYSEPAIINKHAALTNAKIKNITPYIVFLVIVTANDENNNIVEKK